MSTRSSRRRLPASRAHSGSNASSSSPEAKSRYQVPTWYRFDGSANTLRRVAEGNEVSVEEARRIAVRAQALDGSATGVLETVRRLGFLQLDPISTVAPPQHLVLFSRLGPFDVDELDRLLWQERKLIEWHAFLWPIEDLPLVRARMRRRRLNENAWVRDFLQANTHFRRYVLRELERSGPVLSRDLEHDQMPSGEAHRWWGTRQVR